MAKVCICVCPQSTTDIQRHWWIFMKHQSANHTDWKWSNVQPVETARQGHVTRLLLFPTQVDLRPLYSSVETFHSRICQIWLQHTHTQCSFHSQLTALQSSRNAAGPSVAWSASVTLSLTHQLCRQTMDMKHGMASLRNPRPDTSAVLWNHGHEAWHGQPP